jgi:pyruvate/2-oxoglutarate dehydrogenase complex dihydrolipoamide dehydrogenase (E3) component
VLTRILPRRTCGYLTNETLFTLTELPARCATQIREVRHVAGGEKRLVLDCDGDVGEVPADAILVAVGRAPNVEGLDLEAAGVAYDRSGVTVDDHLRTSNRRVFAAGDVCFRYKFTHTADALARIVIRNALFFGRARASALTVPWCTFTTPELAQVGLSEDEARKQGSPPTSCAWTWARWTALAWMATSAC